MVARANVVTSPRSDGPGSSGQLIVTVAGEMSPSLREEFEDIDVEVGHGVTRLRLAKADAATLHGILHRLESFDLEVLEVRRPDRPGGPSDRESPREG